MLVSGATGGLAAPISRRLAQEGAQLTLLGRDIRRLEALDLDASLVTGDLREPATAGHPSSSTSARSSPSTPPPLPPGLDPDTVAARVIAALLDDERDLPGTSFG